MTGLAHHVTQSGNRRQVEDAPWRETFFRDDDYRASLSLLAAER